MRQAICAKARHTHLYYALFAAIVLFIPLLLGLTSTRAYAATLAHGCAPVAPPPVSGTLSVPPATPGIVLFNELLTNPASTWNCSEQGTASLQSDSWIEFYNPQNEALNLYAARAYLDYGPNTYRYYLPFGAAIAAHGYLVVFPDSSSGILAGSNLRLVFLSTMIDQVSIPALPPDSSYARVPDGSQNWQITNNPTIDASNLASTPTSNPTPTAPTTSPAPSRTPTGTQGSDPGGYGYPPAGGTPVVIAGTQPAWNTLNLPTSAQSTQASPTPLATTQTLISPSTPDSSSPTSDVPRRVLLTALLLALAASLYWCWRVYSSP